MNFWLVSYMVIYPAMVVFNKEWDEDFRLVQEKLSSNGCVSCKQ